MELVYLCAFAFAAGLVDSVVGGGGLIQLPALFVFLPSHLASSIPLVFGTNKLSSMCGTAVAVFQYSRRVTIPWSSVVGAAASAFILSAAGAQCVQVLNSDVLKPVVLVLLVLVAGYTYARKDLGKLHAPKFAGTQLRWIAAIIGAVIGFYDGFFGPGTGSFLIFLFIGVLGFDFLTASASAKVVNLATNVAAVIAFGWNGNILYEFALPMALCNVAGSLVGTRLAMLKGNRFVRAFFLTIVIAMIVRFAWEQFVSL